jgi:hypothetical protein
VLPTYSIHLFRNCQIDGSLGAFMGILQLKYLGRKGMVTLCATQYDHENPSGRNRFHVRKNPNPQQRNG